MPLPVPVTGAVTGAQNNGEADAQSFYNIPPHLPRVRSVGNGTQSPLGDAALGAFTNHNVSSLSMTCVTVARRVVDIRHSRE